MIKNTIVSIAFLFVGLTLFSQTQVDIKKKEFKIKGQAGFKEAWKQVNEADDLFLMGKGAYYQSKELYKKAFEYNSTNAELNYKLGISLLMSDEKTSAKDYLELAYQAKPGVAPDITYFLGRAYHMVNEFDRAIEYYNAYKTSLKKKQLKKEGAQIDLMITQCESGKRLFGDPQRIIVENMGSGINSKYGDYTPVVSSNDSLFLFTSRRQHSKKSKIHDVDYKFYETVYYTTKSGRDWGTAKKFFKGKKVKENTAVTGIANNGKMIFLYKGSEGKGDIYYTEYTKNKWQKPKALKGKVNSGDKEGSAAISKDGNILYFTSERKKGQGGSDIWISRKKKNGKWDKPVNAGSVNTPFEEASVSLHPNGKILYFSSMGHNSMGGFDVFQCDVDGSGNLSNVQNMGYPFNSATDDLFYAPSFSGKIGYLSSIRENTLGATDIYKITILGAEKPYVLGYSEITEAGAPGKDRNIFFDEGDKMDVVPVYELSGMITDAETSAPLAGTVQLIEESTKNVIDKVSSSMMGTYAISIPEPSKYIIKALADGYMPYSADVDFSEISKQERDIALDKIKVGKKMIMKNIYFDFGTARLKKSSYAELDNIYEFLLGNPTIKIQISGFTDNIGSIEGNKMISTLRAKACATYLINKGIDKSRIKYKGYGFLNPISHNHTAAGRRKNRRVEFKVLKR